MKIILLTFGSIAFIALGLWMLSLDAEPIEGHLKFNNPTFVYSIAMASIVFFGLCCVLCFKKIFEKSPGFFCNDEL